MSDPIRLPDRKVYRGDPYTMRFVFTDDTGAVVDASSFTWDLQCKLKFGDADTSQAVLGIVEFTAPAAATVDASLPNLVRWDLAETSVWKRTMFRGRLILEDQV